MSRLKSDSSLLVPRLWLLQRRDPLRWIVFLHCSDHLWEPSRFRNLDCLLGDPLQELPPLSSLQACVALLLARLLGSGLAGFGSALAALRAAPDRLRAAAAPLVSMFSGGAHRRVGGAPPAAADFSIRLGSTASASTVHLCQSNLLRLSRFKFLLASQAHRPRGEQLKRFACPFISFLGFDF